MSTILHIENNVNQRILISNELQDEGYEVISVSGGRAGLRLLAKSNPDLIITEAMLPDMDGSELVNRVKSKFEIIPIIVYSTLLFQPDRFINCGIHAFVSKSYDTSVILRTVKSIMDKHTSILSRIVR